MNFLDRAVMRAARAWFAMRGRRALPHAYEAGRRTIRTANWRARNTAADVEIARHLDLLRARSRQMVRDNPYAARIINVLVAHQIGYGITPRAATGDDALDERVNELWARWHARCDVAGLHDFYGLQALAARARAESGEALVRFVRLSPAETRRLGLPLPLQLQVMEGDHLPHQKNSEADGERVCHGIEIDKFGRRVAYYLTSHHPGEDRLFSASDAAERVPAADVLHIYRVLRPGQMRGVPDLAPVLLRLRQLDDYEDASLEAAKVQATLAVFLRNVDLPFGDTKQASEREPIELMPGLVAELPPGVEPTFLTPSGAGAFEPFAMHMLLSIAAGAGVTYDQLTGDMRQANYSSLRASKIEFRRQVEQDQWLLFVPRLCAPVWAEFVRAAIMVGALPDREYPVEWTPPRFEMIDPTKEIPAQRDAIRSGLLSWAEAVSEMGYDPRRMAQQIADSNALLDRHGIILDSDPRRSNRAGTAQDAAQNAVVELTARE